MKVKREFFSCNAALFGKTAPRFSFQKRLELERISAHFTLICYIYESALSFSQV